jgi:hypothetical protein
MNGFANTPRVTDAFFTGTPGVSIATIRVMLVSSCQALTFMLGRRDTCGPSVKEKTPRLDTEAAASFIG